MNWVQGWNWASDDNQNRHETAQIGNAKNGHDSTVILRILIFGLCPVYEIFFCISPKDAKNKLKGTPREYYRDMKMFRIISSYFGFLATKMLARRATVKNGFQMKWSLKWSFRKMYQIELKMRNEKQTVRIVPCSSANSKNWSGVNPATSDAW